MSATVGRARLEGEWRYLASCWCEARRRAVQKAVLWFVRISVVETFAPLTISFLALYRQDDFLQILPLQER